MKKLFVICMIGLLVFSFTACGSDAEATSSEEIANPFTDYETIEEAAAWTGFDIDLPASIEGYNDQAIRAITEGDDKMLEVIYTNDASDEIRIRKALGTGDISGDYSEYKQIITSDDGTNLILQGNDDVINLATWTSGDYTYSVYTSSGMSESNMRVFISSIQ